MELASIILIIGALILIVLVVKKVVSALWDWILALVGIAIAGFCIMATASGFFPAIIGIIFGVGLTISSIKNIAGDFKYRSGGHSSSHSSRGSSSGSSSSNYSDNDSGLTSSQLSKLADDVDSAIICSQSSSSHWVARVWRDDYSIHNCGDGNFEIDVYFCAEQIRECDQGAFESAALDAAQDLMDSMARHIGKTGAGYTITPHWR